MGAMVIRFVALACILGAAGPGFTQKNPERNVYYGEQHLHTSWSFDAFAFGNTIAGPETFYQYATGKSVPHPGSYKVTITKPLDWGAVTDHAEYMGMIQEAADPNSPLRILSPWFAKLLEAGAEKDPILAFKAVAVTIAKGHVLKDMTDPAVVAPVWKRMVEIADKHYRPGKFTTFAAYEWTSNPNGMNLHRNIFFLDSKKVPQVPFTALESTDPRELWQWMDGQRRAGNEVLAISHNANMSHGAMFPTEVDHVGKPIDRAYAEARLRNEPLVELKQLKGQSETAPGLSSTDEFARYEVFVWVLLGGKGGPPREYGSYVRQAYRDGVAMEQALGFNPYKFGLVSGSDSHNASVPYRQKNFQGVHGRYDDTIEKRLRGGPALMGLDNLWITPAGLSAVWAEENTREAIFAAMKRKETYSTSGVRIPVRFFGGWALDAAALLREKNWVKAAYARGVPMGSDLPPLKGKAPTFIVHAVKDPDSANLDRIQIIKGWSKSGQSFEKIYDVAWAGKRKPDPATGKLPPIGSTVNLAKGTYTNTIGAVELKAAWTDPDFDPSLDAFYYARVLEIPTPRWSTIQAVKLGIVPPSGAGFTPAIQERAWSSPVWYTPSAEARKSARQGPTVAELKRQKAVALTDAELKALIVGKTLNVRNTATGQLFEILYGANGQRLVTAIDGKPTDLRQSAELMHAAELSYEIRDGRLVTEIGGAPFEVTVYKLGNRYVAARSNEFGYANYEVEPARQ